MAGLVLPDFGNALASGLQARAFTERENQRQRRQSLGPEVQAAIGGDTGALGRIAAVDPDYAASIGPLIERLDDNKRQVLKRASDFTVQAGVGILNTPPEQQAAAYDAAKGEAQRLGIPTENWPAQWDAKTAGWIQFNVNKARPVASYFAARDKQATEQANMPQPLGVPGGAPTAGGNQGFQNNVGNIRATPTVWQGEGQPHNGFETFATPEDGVRAMHQNLKTYAQRNPSMTVGQAIATWAPPSENNTQAYVAHIAQAGIDPNMPLAAVLADPAQAGRLMQTMAQHEKGQLPAGVGPDTFVRVAGGAQGPSTSPQGGGAPSAPQAPQESPQTVLQGIKLPQGAKVMGIKGVPVVKDGTVMVQMPDGSIDFVPLPARPKAGGQTGGGPFAGTSMDAQAYNIVLRGDPASPEYAAAYAHLAAPRMQFDQQSGTMVPIQPDMRWARPPVPAAPLPAGQAPPAAAPQPPGTPTIGAPVDLGAGRMSDAQTKAAGFADRMRKAEAVLAANPEAGLSQLGRAMEGVPFGLGNYFQSDEYQAFEQARRDFINAVLRRESGAVISAEEFENAEKQYFPQPGDSPATLRQKEQSRRAAIEGMERSAGPVYAKERAAQTPPQAEQPKASAGGSIEQGRTKFDLKKKYGLE